MKYVIDSGEEKDEKVIFRLVSKGGGVISLQARIVYGEWKTVLYFGEDGKAWRADISREGFGLVLTSEGKIATAAERDRG